MTDIHPQFKNFEYVSSLDVDAGHIWLGDPCYIIKDKDEPRPKDLGDDWHGVCERLFERSGYDESTREWSKWSYGRDFWVYEQPEFLEWFEKNHEHPDVHKYGTQVYADKKAMLDALHARYEVDHPAPKSIYKGFANFTHDGGHGGMGTIVSTYYGDGSYPVYIEYGEGGRPRRVLIDFDPGSDEEDEDDES